MRSLRLLAFILIFSLVAATPHIGRWVATASAQTGPTTAGQRGGEHPRQRQRRRSTARNSGNPRKQKKCHFNQSSVDNDNDDPNDLPPSLTAEVNNADPEEDDTITLTLHAWGNEIDQVWWWVPDVFDA